jgi:nicotinamidase-related amidase
MSDHPDMSQALLVIDVQHDLCNGRWAMSGIEHVIPRINAVIAKARAAGAPVVFVQHENEQLVPGSPAWQLDARLDAREGDLRVRKATSDSFHNTVLQAELDARGVDALVVTGLQSDFCVDATVRRALALGYPITLVADGHATMDNDVLGAAQIVAHHNTTLANMDSYGPRARVRTVPAAEVEIS